MAMKMNSIKVLEFLKEHNGEKLTSGDVAEALGLEKRSVDGTFTSLQRKGLGIRTPGEIENADGSHSAVKWLSLSEEGLNYTPDSDAE